MKPLSNIEETIRTKLHVRADVTLHDRVLARVRQAHQHDEHTTLAPSEPVIRRSIMKSPLTKVAIAAAVIVAVVLGLFEFLGSGGTSGVVWAEVIKNVEASRGVIFRTRDSGSRDPNDDWPNGYRIFWRSPAVSRMDVYRGGQIYRTIYLDYDGKTTIGVLHDARRYSKEAMNDETMRGGRGWSDPQGLLKLALSVEHRKLGQKTIDGVLCEGIEGTGPDGSTGRMWVGVETGYPVLVEIEGVDGSTGTMDQFRWNVDLSAEGVEPEIPAGYDPL